MREVRIVGTGSALPGNPVTNEELLRNVRLPSTVTEEWIARKIKIETRYVARDRSSDVCKSFGPAKDFRNSDLCTKAINNALDMAGIDKSEINMLMVASATPDFPVPGTSPIVQEKLGLKECAVMDVRSACCGALTAVSVAVQFLRTGFYRTIAVAGCDVGSIFGALDENDPGFSKQDIVNACMIGDGAGALILRGFTAEEEPHGISFDYIGLNSIGVGKEPGMSLLLGGSVFPATKDRIDKGMQFFKHEFSTILQHGPELFLRGLNDCLQATNTSISDYDLFIPHQANSAIAENAPKFGVPREKMYSHFERVGNTANASILICIDEVMRANKLAENSRVMVCAAESTKWMYVVMGLRWHSLTGAKIISRRERLWFFNRWIAGITFWVTFQLAKLRSSFGI